MAWRVAKLLIKQVSSTAIYFAILCGRKAFEGETNIEVEIEQFWENTSK